MSRSDKSCTKCNSCSEGTIHAEGNSCREATNHARRANHVRSTHSCAAGAIHDAQRQFMSRSDN